MCLWKTWEQAPLPRSLVPSTLRGCLEVLWGHKNVTHCTCPFGCFWLLCRVYLFYLFIGLLYLLLFQKWFKAGMEVGSDMFWESVGCVLLSCDMDMCPLVLWLGYVSSCPVTWIYTRVIPRLWPRSVHIFHMGSFADLVIHETSSESFTKAEPQP